MLLLIGGDLHWRPDGYEQRHGDQPWQWPVADVRCHATRHRRDITGIAYLEVILAVAQGIVVLAISGQTGPLPPLFTQTAPD